MLERLMREHQKETEALRATQQRNRDKQMRKLQDRLEENREQWSQRKEAEKMEQEQLRQYEDDVVKYVLLYTIHDSKVDYEKLKVLSTELICRPMLYMNTLVIG
jgi:hypothetical protein